MDPLSIIASVASILELGLKVSKGVDGIVRTWKTASPVIFAINNEVSDLNVVLDHMSHAWHGIQKNPGVNKYDAHFSEAFNAQLEQAEDILGQVDQLIRELRAMSSFKMKLKWLSRNSRVAEQKNKLKDVRLRLSELLLAYNVTSISKIELEIKEVHATVQQNHVATMTKLDDTAAPIIRSLQQNITYQNNFTAAAIHNHSTSLSGHRDMDTWSSLQRASAAMRGVVPTAASNPAPMDGALPVRFIARPRRNICTSRCQCRCHSNNKHSIALRTSLFGNLFVGYSGIPGMSYTCNERSCMSRDRATLEVSYVFPLWFLCYAISLFMIRTRSGGPNIGLFITKRIPHESGNILWAARQGDIAHMEKLIMEDPYCVHYTMSTDGRTAMHYAVVANQFEAVKLLLDQGANPDVKADKGFTAREVLAQSWLFPKPESKWNREKIASILPVNQLLDELPFIAKVIMGICHADLNKILSRKGPKTDEMIREVSPVMAWTPLHWAVMCENLEAVRALIKAGADLDQGDVVIPRSPLFSAMGPVSYKIRQEIFDELVAAGADIYFVGGHGWMPFHSAAHRGDLVAMAKLVALGVDPNILTRNYVDAYTAASVAALFEKPEVLRYLDSIGADLEVTNVEGESPFQTAIIHNSHECLRFLLERRASHFDVVETDGFGTLHNAALCGDVETMLILAEAGLAGLDVTARSRNGRTPQQVFEDRGAESEEIRLAWNMLLESVDVANGENWDWNQEMQRERTESVETLPAYDEVKADWQPPLGQRREEDNVRIQCYEDEFSESHEDVDVFHDAMDKLVLEESKFPTMEHLELVG